MTDYPKATGNAGTLIIRDDGSTVSLIVKCTDGQTWAGSVAFDTTVNGARQTNTVNLPGGFGEKTVRAEPVSAAQTVIFNMPYTGTGGLGGPTNHSAAISRTPPPPIAGPPISAPVADRVYDIKPGSALLQFAWGPGGTNDGGSPITSWHTNWAEHPSEPIGVGSIYTTGQPSTMSPLRPVTDYWCSVRAVNAYGTGPWSNALQFRTIGGAYVSNGSAWLPYAVLVDDGADAVAAEVLVSNGTAWVGAL